MKTCAFTGHRPEKMPWGKDENSPSGVEFKFRLREALEYLIGKGCTDFLSGGARGFDLIAAEIVLSPSGDIPLDPTDHGLLVERPGGQVGGG